MLEGEHSGLPVPDTRGGNPRIDEADHWKKPKGKGVRPSYPASAPFPFFLHWEENQWPELRSEEGEKGKEVDSALQKQKNAGQQKESSIPEEKPFR
jgi:hypothetical protein